MTRNKILVVDDDALVRFGVRDFLQTHGYEVEEANTCQHTQELFRTFQPDVALLDYQLPDGTALELLPRLKQIDESIPLIVLTGNGTIDLAVRAMKEGAEQFLIKPVDLPSLLVIIKRLLENQRNRQKLLVNKTRAARRPINPFLGTSPVIRQLAEQANRVATASSAILIQGETGTGKGVLAAWLHHHGPRAEEAFVDLNCAGLTRELLDTELFGHEKGAFTGATATKLGLFEVAHRGSIFLDEIGDVDPLVQPKLLKVLEEKRFRRLGDVRDRLVDVRLIAATSHDLSQLVREKRFRSDLYFRINTLRLLVPALRERSEDIPLLAEHLLQSLALDLGRGEVSLSPAAERALQTYAWPGNVRELRNVLERAVLLSDHLRLTPEDLLFEDQLLHDDYRLERPAANRAPTEDNLRLALREAEQRHIERVLQEEHGRVEEAARRLGLHRSSLYEKIRKFGVSMSKV